MHENVKKRQIMKFNKFITAVSAIALLLSACGEKPQPTPKEVSVDSARIKAHLEFLADDTLRGRDTGSEGYQIAANYVASNFKQLGLKPMGEHGGFEQEVRFRRATVEKDGAQLAIQSSGSENVMKPNQDFIMSGAALRTEAQISAEMVFVGYGVIAEDFGYNDYKDLDVEGKVVVALFGRPADLPSEEGAHIGSGSEKLKHAAERGAVGFITLYTPKRDKVRPFATTVKYAQGPRYSWLTKEDVPFGKYEEIQVSATVHFDKAQVLFEGAEQTAEQIFELDNSDQPVKGFALTSKVSMSNRSSHEEITSPNVVAAIEGSDPVLKDEYVVFSAHLDHIGINRHTVYKDRINNGAIDNASGVSILLETARLLTESEEKPKRSILFVVVTAEEKGLLGSSYFANNPTVPVMQMVANVNLDMPLLLYNFADVIAFGATHSTMGASVEKAAAKVNVGLSPDPMPEQALFTRSDHYNFVKAGIPSVFLMTGFKSTDEGVDGGKVFKKFLRTHYHNNSDESSLPINYDAAKKFVEVNMMIGQEIANQEERPKWHDGDFFGKTFAQ